MGGGGEVGGVGVGRKGARRGSRTRRRVATASGDGE